MRLRQDRTKEGGQHRHHTSIASVNVIEESGVFMRPHQQRLFLLAPLVLVLLPFLIGPTLFGFFASFTNYGPTEIHLRFVGVANYTSVLRDHQFSTAASNILWFTLVTVSA